MALSPNVWQPWDDRYAKRSAVVRNWQLAFGAMTLFAFLSLGAALWLASRIRYVAFAVSVDKLGYALTQLQPLTPDTSPDVIARIKGYEIAKYIREARSVTNDLQVEHQTMLDLFAHTRGPARQFLFEYYGSADKSHNPSIIAAKQTVTVQVDSILPVSAATYTVRWSEQRYDLHGVMDGAPTHWEAQFGTEIVSPKSSDAIVSNPIGMFVDQITWTEVGAAGGQS